jgi:hypothetical protein
MIGSLDPWKVAVGEVSRRHLSCRAELCSAPTAARQCGGGRGERANRAVGVPLANALLAPCSSTRERRPDSPSSDGPTDG